MKPVIEPGGRAPAKRSVPVRNGGRESFDNATRQRKALKLMTPCELETGKTAAQLDALQAEQRARVLERHGMAA